MDLDNNTNLDTLSNIIYIYYTMPFRKGTSGNPNGRAGGVATREIQLSNELKQMIEIEAPLIINKLISLAKEGDLIAIKICLDRIFPKKADIRETFIQLSIPDPTKGSFAQLNDMSAEVDERTNRGEISLESAQMLYDIIEKKRRLLETTEMEGRIAKLESSPPDPKIS